MADAFEQLQQLAPPPAAPQAGPSGEVIDADGTRRGVDESGRPYQADASGDESDRERLDKFGPPGASTK